MRSLNEQQRSAWEYMKSKGGYITLPDPIGAPYKVDSPYNNRCDCVNTVNIKRWFDAIIEQLWGRPLSRVDVPFPLGTDLEKIIGKWKPKPLSDYRKRECYRHTPQGREQRLMRERRERNKISKRLL